MLVVILNRVFESNNMMLLSIVEMVDHTGERSRLSTSCRSSHEEQPSRTGDQFANNLRKPKLLKGQELVRNTPQHHSDVTTLLKDRHTKACFISKRETKVCSTNFLQFLLISFGSNTLHQSDGIFRL